MSNLAHTTMKNILENETCPSIQQFTSNLHCYRQTDTIKLQDVKQYAVIVQSLISQNIINDRQ